MEVTAGKVDSFVSEFHPAASELIQSQRLQNNRGLLLRVLVLMAVYLTASQKGRGYKFLIQTSSVRPSFYTFFGQVKNLARACELVLRLRTIAVLIPECESSAQDQEFRGMRRPPSASLPRHTDVVTAAPVLPLAVPLAGQAAAL